MIVRVPKRLNGFFHQRIWYVKTTGISEKVNGQYDLSFSSRQDARMYKKLLEKSSRRIQATIISHEISDGLMVSEEAA